MRSILPLLLCVAAALLLAFSSDLARPTGTVDSAAPEATPPAGGPESGDPEVTSIQPVGRAPIEQASSSDAHLQEQDAATESTRVAAEELLDQIAQRERRWLVGELWRPSSTQPGDSPPIGPLANTELSYELRKAPQAMGSMLVSHGRAGPLPTTETDEVGRFRVRVGPDGYEDIVFRASLEGVTHEAYVVLMGKTFEYGDNDVGRLRFEERRPLVSGVVVNDAGDPLVGGTVRVSWGRRVGESGKRRVYYPVEDGDTLVQDDGTFAIFARAPRDELRVFAEREDHLTAEADCAAGDELELRVLRAAGLRGRVLVDEGFSLGGFTVKAKQDDWNYRKRDVKLAADGRFEWLALDPGPVRVELYSPRWNEPIATIDALEAVAGGIVDDARTVIDLRGQLLAVTVEVVDFEGDAIPNAFVQLAGHPPEDRDKTGEDGRAHLVGPGPGLDLRVFAPEYLAVDLENVSTDQRVTLLPSSLTVPVRVEVTGAVSADESVSVLLEDASGEYTRVIRWSPLPADGVPVIHASYPGPHHVSVWLKGPSPRGGISNRRLNTDGTSAAFEVPPGGGGPELVLRLDEAALEAGRQTGF